MGKVYKGIHPDLAVGMKEKFNLSCFVETGTYMGKTAVWASGIFEKVYTIESDWNIYAQTVTKLHAIDNIVCFHGFSQELLPIALRMFKTNALIWLDAHWSRDLGYAKFDKAICPVMEELAILSDDSRRHVIFIDDMRLFGKTAGWPTVKEVTDAMLKMNRIVYFTNDIIVGVPA